MELPERRAPTAAEAKALGHPTRLRILFACRASAMTNKELAQALGTTPGTIHYHLRPLVAEGFLRAEEPRAGARGSREQPYSATGKSWELSGSPADTHALRQVVADELLHVDDADSVTFARVGATLPDADLRELVDRLQDLAEEFKRRGSRPPGGAGAPATASYSLIVGVQRQSG